MFDYDAELVRYHARLMGAVDIKPDARVLDVGCGTGQTTRAAARAAYAGDVIGVDVSTAMVARARRLSTDEGLTNVAFECGDAESHWLPPGRFTLAISRFGTMFFTDPTAAFTNIARSLRPGAPLVQLVWQPAERQEWATAIRAALTPGGSAPIGGPDAFSLGHPDTIQAVLTAAGFTNVNLIALHEAIYYGPDVVAARDNLLALPAVTAMLPDAPAARDRTLQRLEAQLRDHQTSDGVWFDSCAWLVTAHRASGQ
ncbi:class I SAM-dependent methyltransferase [Phytoactinopolyspora limicola]|uniref:class I SAM-dependent methyltransferase n=1 Tax=Phytoactinopolyspora limicola TaxID=2715536 RepID=UPI001FE36CEE|nr:class I SAM-dependent methyltransferase [Phytoactinopolyspora limicola]